MEVAHSDILKRMSDMDEAMKVLKSAMEKETKKFQELEERLSQLGISTDDAKEEEQEEKSGSFCSQLANNIIAVTGSKCVSSTKHTGVKITWLIMFIIGVSATIFFTYRTAKEYLAQPKATEVRLNASSSYEFPPVAICPAAWIDAEKAMELGLTRNAIKYSLSYVSGFAEKMEPHEVPKARAEFLDFYKSRNFSSMVEYFNNVSVDLRAVYKHADFQNQSMVVRLNNNKSEFISKIFLHYQVCHAYSFAPTGRSLSGTTGAIVKFYDKTRGIIDRVPDVWIHLRTHRDMLFSPVSPIYALADHRTRILVRTQRFVMLNTDKPQCKFGGRDGYSSTVCSASCVNKRYKAAVGCQVFRYSGSKEALNPWDTCNFLEILNGTNFTFSEFQSSAMHDSFLEDCFAACPRKCDRTVYQLHVQWQQRLRTRDPESIFDDFGDNSTQERESYFEIFVEHSAKYDGQTTSYLEVATYSFTVLVNNVGGALGLFIGATMMTFVQAVLHCVDHIIRFRIRKSSANKQAAPRNNNENSVVVVDVTSEQL